MIEAQVRELVDQLLADHDMRTQAQRIDAIAEIDAAIHMLQAALNLETVAFEEQRSTADRGRGIETSAVGRGVRTEVAMARRVSPATIDYQLGFARPLVTDFPTLLQACLDGKVSQPAAKAIVKECEPLTPELRRAVDAELTGLALELTPGQLRKTAARKAAAVDPDAMAKKAKIARAKKTVRLIMNNDATATLTALLPAEQGVKCWEHLDNTARGIRADGDERPISQLMTDLLVERLTGQTKATDVNLEVGVVVAATSILGVDDQPGKLTGSNGGDYGTLPADLIRQLTQSEHT